MTSEEARGRDLVLASTSRYRRKLLERLGVPFRCRAPLVDEDQWKASASEPRVLAEDLAKAKALSLRDEEPDATLIGCDQLVSFEGRIFGKPASVAGAVEQLSDLAGRSHELITALAVWHDGRVFAHTDVTTLRMRSLDRSAIERYVAADRPNDCAGSYRLEERGITLFESIDSEDHSSITGLPLIALTTILRQIGFIIP
jgi:septum formation protein